MLIEYLMRYFSLFNSYVNSFNPSKQFCHFVFFGFAAACQTQKSNPQLPLNISRSKIPSLKIKAEKNEVKLWRKKKENLERAELVDFLFTLKA